MAKLAYYASCIPGKENWFETPEGYRIYRSVPICRTGTQQYAGSELKKHADYDPAWNIGDKDLVTVDRPAAAVTAPETIASFEGKTVVDDHPPGDVAVVYVENEDEYGCGHAQNIRVGDELDNGERTLVADLFVKNQILNDKIDAGKRDISCGYLYTLTRDDAGKFLMTEIRGNHIAVVRKGRAGPEVSIQDHAFVVEAAEQIPEHQPDRKVINMAVEVQTQGKSKFSWARILKALSVSDAVAPEDLDHVARHIGREDEDDPEKRVDRALARAKAARDAEKEAEEEEEEKAAADKAAKDKAAKDKAAAEKAAKDAEEATGKGEVEPELHPRLMQACDHIASMHDSMEALKEHLGLGKDPDGGEATADAGLENALILTPEEDGKSTLSEQIGANDSASRIAFLKAMKPIVAAAKNKAVMDAYNAEVLSLTGRSAKGTSQYAGLAGGSPFGKDDDEAVEVDPMSFFNGVSHKEGQRRLEAHLAAKKGNK